jgi:hypothetical protein
MLALSGKEVTLIGSPGSQSIIANGGITFNCKEIDEIRGSTSPIIPHLAIPEEGLTRKDFLSRFTHITPLNIRAEKILSELGHQSDTQTYSKQQLLNCIDKMSFIPIGKNLSVTTDTRNLTPHDYVIVATKAYSIDH